MCFDIAFFYLSTPLGIPEYVKIMLFKYPEEFITEYNLTSLVHKGWIYFEIRPGCYGLSQSSMLANKQLRLRLEKEGYYEARTTPGLWRHKYRPIQFCLVMDDFGVEYVGKKHEEHLATKFKNHNLLSKKPRRIHHRIQPHQLGAQRLDIFQNPPGMLWITPIWYAGKQTTQIEIRKGRIL